MTPTRDDVAAGMLLTGMVAAVVNFVAMGPLGLSVPPLLFLLTLAMLVGSSYVRDPKGLK